MLIKAGRTMTEGELLILALRALVTTTEPDETMTLGEFVTDTKSGDPAAEPAKFVMLE